jgi:hypothetical protein
VAHHVEVQYVGAALWRTQNFRPSAWASTVGAHDLDDDGRRHRPRVD